MEEASMDAMTEKLVWGETEKLASRKVLRCPLCGGSRSGCTCPEKALWDWADRQLILPGVDADPHATVVLFLRARRKARRQRDAEAEDSPRNEDEGGRDSMAKPTKKAMRDGARAVKAELLDYIRAMAEAKKEGAADRRSRWSDYNAAEARYFRGMAADMRRVSVKDERLLRLAVLLDDADLLLDHWLGEQLDIPGVHPDADATDYLPDVDTLLDDLLEHLGDEDDEGTGT
jgi:hypothetical protein